LLQTMGIEARCDMPRPVRRQLDRYADLLESRGDARVLNALDALLRIFLKKCRAPSARAAGATARVPTTLSRRRVRRRAS
jgi:hypothetical protein